MAHDGNGDGGSEAKKGKGITARIMVRMAPILELNNLPSMTPMG